MRLGAKRTVKGYIEALKSRDLLWPLNVDPPPDNVTENWKRVLSELPRKWSPDELTSSLGDFLGPLAWGKRQSARRGVLGREMQMSFCLPSVIDVVHYDLNMPNLPAWNEHCILIHGWNVSARARKAKIDIVPGFVAFSSHALERIYERTGGCEYEEFPSIIGNIADTILHKVDPLLVCKVYHANDEQSPVMAFPCDNGIAVIEIHNAAIGRDMPQFGITVRVNGNAVTVGPGLHVPIEDESSASLDCGFVTTYLVRTFYGMDDLNEDRSDSRMKIDLLLDFLPPSPASIYGMMQVDPPEWIQTALPKEINFDSHSFAALVADARDSLSWLDPPRKDQIFLFPTGMGNEAENMTQYMLEEME